MLLGTRLIMSHQLKPPQTIKQYLLRCLIARLREASANSAAAAAAEAAL